MDIISLMETEYGITEKEAEDTVTEFMNSELVPYLEFDIKKFLPNAELIAEYRIDAVGYHNRAGKAEGISVYLHEDKYLVYSFYIEGDEDEAFQYIPTDWIYPFFNLHFKVYDDIDPILLLNKDRRLKNAKNDLKFVRGLFLYFSTEEEMVEYIIKLE
jgi:hypothetical protein